MTTHAIYTPTAEPCLVIDHTLIHEYDRAGLVTGRYATVTIELQGRREMTVGPEQIAIVRFSQVKSCDIGDARPSIQFMRWQMER